MKKIIIDREKDIPIYLQIYSQFKNFIENGSLPPGYKLPTIRSLAKELGVNIITVVSAYRLLEENGYVYTRVGSGTYVCETLQRDRDFLEDIDISEHKEIHVKKGIVNFASSSLNPELFPVDEFAELINRVLKRDRGYAFEYQDSRGYKPLREAILGFVRLYGIETNIERIQVISGGQQGIDVVSKALINFGDTIIVERPTYSWALASFQSRGADILEVDLNEDGINLENLEDKLKKFKPKFIYVMPNFHNPTGILYSDERKKRLVELVEKYETYILEDDFASELSFSEKEVLPLKAFDKYDRVIYLKSFSKVHMPGLRLGFIIAPEKLVSSFLKAKYVTDLTTSGLMQRAFDLYLRENIWKKHIKEIKQVIKERFEAMREGLDELKSYIDFKVPEGGFFYWVKLKREIKAIDIYQKCLEKGLLIVPGDMFFGVKKEEKFLRLSFASCDVPDIKRGVEILKNVFEEMENDSEIYIPII
jgi:DNA-binding transcriptional MocR family regulator